MNEQTGPRKAGWKAKLGLFLVSLSLTALVAEVGLRLCGFEAPHVLTPEDRRQYKFEPGGSFIYRGYLDGMFSDFATPVRLNRLGFHDVEHRIERAATNTYRLMVVGDSYVAALSCPLEQTFYRRLEARLQRDNPLGRPSYEVIACGQGNQAQEKETLYVQKLGPDYRPDAVLLLFFCGNDFMENSPETFRAAAKFAALYKKVIAPKKLAFFDKVYRLRWSRLNGLIAAAATTWYANHLHLFCDDVKKDELVSPELGVYRVPLAPEWQRAYDRTGHLLADLKSEVAKLGVPFLVAGLSGPQAIGDVGQKQMMAGGGAGMDSLQPARWLEAWCKTNDVPYVGLEGALSAAGKHKVFWRHDGHLNPFGNEVVVAPLFDLVVRHAPAK